MQRSLLKAGRALEKTVESAVILVQFSAKLARAPWRSRREALKKIGAAAGRVAVGPAARGSAASTAPSERIPRRAPRFRVRRDRDGDCWALDARRNASRRKYVKGEITARCASCRTRAVKASTNARKVNVASRRSVHVYYPGDGLLGRTAGLGRARDGPTRPAGATRAAVRACGPIELGSQQPTRSAHLHESHRLARSTRPVAMRRGPK